MIKFLIKHIFSWFDNKLFTFLKNNSNLVPERWVKFLAMFYPDARIRKIYWACQGVSMGVGTYANYGFTIVKNANDSSNVVIGDNVSIAPGVIVITDSSPNNSFLMQAMPYIKTNLIKEKSVIIEDDVWIGAGVIILPGIRIQRGAIVGAGSVVIKDVLPFTIVAGSPARFIRNLENGE